MDILKVLSRGIKQPVKGARAVGNGPANLPSAGNRTNPQLFHDDVKSSRGSKRKRPGDDADADEEEELPEVDFFAPKEQAKNGHDGEGEGKGAASSSSSSSNPAATQQQDDATQQHAVKAPKLLSEDECRQLLRSHRLKLTLMSPRRRVPDAKVTKSKKDKNNGKKKQKKASDAKKDNEPLQLHPQPLSSFRELRSVYGISEKLAANIQHESYREPTEVQLASLPLLLRPDVALKKSPDKDDVGHASAGVDFLAVAPTGSGKTLSFLVPAIDDILRRKQKQQGAESGEQVELAHIVVAPTRELVFQIVNEGRKLAAGTGIRFAGMRKGARLPAEQEETVPVENDSDSEVDDEEDERGEGGERQEAEDASDADDDHGENKSSKAVTKADILVTTPALLMQYLSSSGTPKTRKTLPTVRSLILDEADVLLDPLFREATTGLRSACTHPHLRTSFWSATMGSNIETLVKGMCESPPRSLSASAAPSSAPAPLIRLVVGLKDTAVPNITHKLVYAASEQGKLLAIRQLLHPNSGDDSGPPLRPPFLVFTQTIDRATALEDELKYDIPLTAGGPSRIASLHSNLNDAARAAVMRRFRAGHIWVLITTDVLARGVDFAGVNGVVNYDIPGSAAAYVHRAGRTGRAGREGGVAVTLYTLDDIPFVKTVANVVAISEKQAGKDAGAADAGVQKWLLDALPDVGKDDRKKLKERGVESRRFGGKEAKITSRSGWERRRENNRQGAIEASKQRKQQARRTGDAGAAGEDGGHGEWGGIDD